MGTLYSVDASTGNITTAGSITSNSTSSGFLLPRLTTTQRDAIASPATGLEIFNTTINEIEFYNGSAWTGISGGGTINPGTLDQLAYYSVSGSTISGSSVLSVSPSSGLVLNGVNIGISNTNAYSISSASLLTLSGSPYVSINSDLSLIATHNIILHDDTNSINTINIKGPTSAISSTYTLRMPTAQGGANTFLQNDGSGNLSWGTGSGITGSGTTSYIPKFTSGSAIGNSGLVDNGTPIGMTYSMSTSGQLFPYLTLSDGSTGLYAAEGFTSHIATFNTTTNVCTLPSFSGSLVIVNGYATSADRSFTDLILVSAGDSGVTAAFTVVASNGVNAGTRTYSTTQRTLQMSISDSPAHTYNVGVKVTSAQ